MAAPTPAPALHPVAWLVWAGVCTIIVATTRNPLYVALVALCAGAAYRAARTTRPGLGVAQWALLLRAVWTLTFIAVLFNMLTVHTGDRVIAELPRGISLLSAIIGGPITFNALLYGVISALALGTLILAFAALNAAVGYEDLLRLLPRPLTGLGVTMTVALGFLPQTIAALGEVREAQAVRGHTIRRSLRDLPPLVVPVLALGLERAVALAEAMAARGFGVPSTRHNRIRRTAYRAHPWHAADSAVVSGSALAALIVAVFALTGSALVYYPYPTLLWPPFDPLLGAALLPLLLPALLIPFVPARDSRPLSEPESADEQPALPPQTSASSPLARLDRVTYSYPRASASALQQITWDMCDGEAVVVLGPSGAGKSTLLRTFNGLAPHFSGGRFGGAVVVDGRAAHRDGPRAMSAVVGMLFQDPETAAVAPRVADDVAFALEQHGTPRPEMRRRVRDALDAVGMAHLTEREIATLSGGERQRVALAAAIVRAPRLLVLDEPTSQLDPDGVAAVLDAVAAVQAASGMGVILAEHRLERVIARATAALLLPGDGSLVHGDVRSVLARARDHGEAWVPPVAALGRALGWEPLPLSVAEARGFVARDGLTALSPPSVPTSHPAGAPILAAEGVSVTLGGQSVLRDIDLTLHAGEIVAVVGANGAGKTTLLRALLGLQPIDAGRVTLAGRDVTTGGIQARVPQTGYVPQQPGALLFAETVADEIAFTQRARGLRALPERYGDTEGLLQLLRLGGMAGRYPRDLSVGERARVAVAATLAGDPAIILLDEPTRGLDPAARDDLIALLRGLRDDGRTILLVTHDAELVARVADRVALLDRGRMAALGPPRAVLPGTPFAPQINQLLGGTFLSVADVRAALPARQMVEMNG